MHPLATQAAVAGALRLDESPRTCRVRYEGDPESAAVLHCCGGSRELHSEQLELGERARYPVTIGLDRHAARAPAVASMRLTASLVVHTACARNRQLIIAAR